MDKLLETLNILIGKIDKITLPQDLKCFTIKEVANILGASENTIYNMIYCGSLKAFTIGVKDSKKPVYRISKEALDNYIKSSCNELKKEVAFNG